MTFVSYLVHDGFVIIRVEAYAGTVHPGTRAQVPEPYERVTVAPPSAEYRASGAGTRMKEVGGREREAKNNMT